MRGSKASQHPGTQSCRKLHLDWGCGRRCCALLERLRKQIHRAPGRPTWRLSFDPNCPCRFQILRRVAKQLLVRGSWQSDPTRCRAPQTRIQEKNLPHVLRHGVAAPGRHGGFPQSHSGPKESCPTARKSQHRRPQKPLAANAHTHPEVRLPSTENPHPLRERSLFVRRFFPLSLSSARTR